MNKELPTKDKCIQLLEDAGCSKKVINHCKAVSRLALKIAENSRQNVDKNLVEVGSLLHDIGRCKTHDILHVPKGAKMVEKLGLPNRIVQIVRNHIGAGVDKDEAEKLGLPYEDFTPKTLEEKIVCHADNLIDGCRRQTIEAEVEEALQNGLKNYAIKLVKLHKELSDLCGIDLNKI
ncbi:MAG: HDIG domain-containing metalloprotein [Candidatus Thermoplasmatota archaeon]